MRITDLQFFVVRQPQVICWLMPDRPGMAASVAATDAWFVLAPDQSNVCLAAALKSL